MATQLTGIPWCPGCLLPQGPKAPNVPCWVPLQFCNHIFKINLDHVIVEMLGVAVDQVDLLGVHVVHLLLVHFVCHGLVVGLVDVALFPDGNSVEMSLQRADGQEEESGTGSGKKFSKRKTSDQKSAWRWSKP